MKIKIINKSKWPLPAYANSADAGCDLRANIEEPVTLRPFSGMAFPTGIHVGLPRNVQGTVAGRSGLNFKHGIIVPDGTVDPGYVGEVKVKLYNLSDQPYTFQPGERIAQFIITRFEQAEWVEVEELDESERGDNGIGSSGRK